MRVADVSFPDQIVLTCLVCGEDARATLREVRMVNDESAWVHLSLVCPCGALVTVACHPPPAGVTT